MGASYHIPLDERRRICASANTTVLHGVRLQRAVYDAIQAGCPREPDHVEIDYGHGRIIKRSLWVTDAGDIDFPHAGQAVRIRRDGYDITGAAVSKEVVHAVTSLDAGHARPADLAAIAKGQWGIESVHWIRDAAVRFRDWGRPGWMRMTLYQSSS